MDKKTQTAMEMIKYYSGDTKRIEHFMKVHGYARLIGESVGLDSYTMELLEVTAYLHDIGIKVSEEKYNSSSGYYQQIEGPAIAEKMLLKIGYDKNFIDRVCYLISRHHKYSNIDGIDCQILIESDFLVNAVEDNISMDTMKDIKDKIFKTEAGKKILSSLRGV